MAPNSAARQRPLRVLLPALGSAGDVHPVIALGLALRARSHRVTILTNPHFQPLIEQQGLRFLPVGTLADADAAIADPDLWHPRKGFGVVAQRVMVPAIAAIYRLIETHADADTVVATSGIALGARVAQEKLGVPTATIHLQPSIIRSLVDQGLAGTLRISASQPMWFKQAFFRLVDWLVVDCHLKRPLNEFRATLGLRPVSRVLRRWVHSPQCVIGFFPQWFAPPQPDWPPQVHLVGFPLWDAAAHAVIPPEAEEFLTADEPPLVFTPGSAASMMQRFFRESAAAVREIDRRAMFVTNYPAQLPRALPSGVRSFGYLPFSAVLPRAALLVYHGGIGTLAQAIKAGIPHLVVPNGHDQFDNGWRIERIGLGRSIPQRRYRGKGVAEALRALLSDSVLRQRARDYAARMDSVGALTRACELIEALAAGG
ncbi:MAG TPA: nucleotide disphospho-sugar-binding domain-containing protein [Steroidobacteraceae bacterium]|jgi:rhamnosyltransferase subunit B|nr:nucleotide disphospho-sugar-binding domain-containing protein [Steroidobacteraceae bacterium]